MFILDIDFFIYFEYLKILYKTIFLESVKIFV